MAKSILHRISSEIHKLNGQFKHFGLEGVCIGYTSLERLRKLADNREFVSTYMITLPLLIPFLDITYKQDYLVKRIHGKTNQKDI